MIEFFLTKIASVIFKKALFGSVLKILSSAYEIYSVIDTMSDLSDCVETTNDCDELGVCGIKVVSNPLTELAFGKLVEIGNHTYTVEKTSSGIYIASSIIPTFKVTNSDFPTGVFYSGGLGGFSSGSTKNYFKGGKGSFSSGSKNF